MTHKMNTCHYLAWAWHGWDRTGTGFLNIKIMWLIEMLGHCAWVASGTALYSHHECAMCVSVGASVGMTLDATRGKSFPTNKHWLSHTGSLVTSRNVQLSLNAVHTANEILIAEEWMHIQYAHWNMRADVEMASRGVHPRHCPLTATQYLLYGV